MNSLDLQAAAPDALFIARMAVQLYAETHPRPPHVTQKQAALMLYISAPTVGRLVKAGLLRLNGTGQIPIADIDAVLTARRAG